MAGYSTIIACALLLGTLLCSGCLGEKAEASTGVKYVCSDGSIVSETRECRTEAKPGTCDKTTCPAPIEKECVCNQTCPVPAVKTMLPPEGNASLPADPIVSSGPCESMGCQADALFVGNSETKKFHTCDCAQGARISPKKRVCLTSAKEAESLGFIPCGFCKPSDKV
jgi:hypothetical protein